MEAIFDEKNRVVKHEGEIIYSYYRQDIKAEFGELTERELELVKFVLGTYLIGMSIY